MVLTLPPVKEGALVTFDYFSTAQQCFVFRNWDMILASRLAEILRSSVENVQKLVAGMGASTQKLNQTEKEKV